MKGWWASMMVVLAVAGAALAGCGPTAEPQGADLGCLAAVDGIESLRDGLQIPEHLQQEDAVKQGGEFDANRYFEVLTHLSMEPGYVLDYAYYYDGMGGFPMLYARAADQAPYQTADEYRTAQPGSGAAAQAAYMDWVRVDDTEAGFLQYVVLQTMATQFYLHWHAGYNDTKIVCGREGLEGIFADMETWDLKMDAGVKQQARGLELEPTVTLEGDTAVVRVVTFTKWGGFERVAYTISRGFPHKLLNTEVESTVQYDCGIMF